MQSMVYEILIAFGLIIVAEVAFQIADFFDGRQRRLRNSNGTPSGSRPRRLRLAVR